MKRHLAIIIIICLSLVACGNPKATVPKDTIDFFGDDFTWNMTIKDAEDYIKKNQVNELILMI